MSTSTERPNILLNYEQIPEQNDFYFIPASNDLPLSLVHAITRLNDVFINHVEKSPQTDRQWKDTAYLQAAITTSREYLDDQNEYEQNRFFAMLEPFRVSEDNEARIEVGGDNTLLLIRTGILM